MTGVPDRYVLLAVSVVIVMILTIVVASPRSASDSGMGEEEIVGVVFDIKESAKGYTFTLEDTSGAGRRCYFPEMPVDDGVYAVTGEVSEDGMMFFVRQMRLLA
ncbi:MAG: hypothetical protein LBS92_02935 [Candidatus Methanoplasma sp.]|jgi:hypothetical protein|nr:hypothetical protein [Candidatus Methanoplasma sp.]